MRVLVTGGAGFIGSHLCEKLLDEGHWVVIMDDFNDFYDPRLKHENLAVIQHAGDVKVVEADICDPQAVEDCIRANRIDAIVHLAARAGVRPSLADPRTYERTNVGGTLNLLEAARRHSVQRFLLASSSSVYGIAKQVPFSEADTENLPISPYAATKLAAEKLCFTYAHLYGMAVCCLRFFTVYGPRQRPDLAIAKFIKAIDQGKPIPMFGDGSSGRDFTYCDDVVEGILAALSLSHPFEVINLGNSSPVKLRDLIQAIELAVGKKAKIERLPDQPGDVPLTYADISKAARLLGYKPATSLAEGLAKQVAWHRGERTPFAVPTASPKGMSRVVNAGGENMREGHTPGRRGPSYAYGRISSEADGK